jgi:hypothetical protein
MSLATAAAELAPILSFSRHATTTLNFPNATKDMCVLVGLLRGCLWIAMFFVYHAFRGG